MKKVLFPILALVLALGLSLPMAMPVAASPATVLLTPSWSETTGTEVNPTAGGLGTATKPWDDMTPWGSWTAAVWDGADPSQVSGRTIPNFESNWTWMYWIHVRPDWTQHTDRWLHTQVSIPASWDVQAVQLVHVRNSTPTVLYDIPINDDLYVYVDQTYVAGGGTAAANIAGGSTVNVDALLGYPTPPDPDGDDSEGWPDPYFKAAVGFGRPGDLPEVDWDIPGGFGLPPEFFTPGIHDIHVLVEEFRDSGGIGHLGFEIEYDIVSIDITKEADSTSVNEGDIITYTYYVHNDGDVPLAPPTVTDSLGIAVTGVDESPADGFNDGDANTDDVFDCCETWNFTANYTVAWFYDCYTVENTATASALYEAIEVTDESNLVVVDIMRNPAIEVRKSGPTDAYFQSVNAAYTYEVKNVGDCGLLKVSLLDDMASPEYASGDTGDADVMIPGEIWVYEATELLECECETITCFTNKATVTAEDIKGEPADDEACWTILVFQWQPRTIGYWGNWDNHYTNEEIMALVNAVKRQSCYFRTEGLEVGGVHDLLLGKVKVKGRMTVAKATALLEKQLLATWFNVKSYEDWVGDIAIPTFEGSPDAAMDPNATVYVDGEAMTVQEILDRIEYNICTNSTSDIQFLLKAKDILDDLNNAENNSYEMFIPPHFDADACPLVLENKAPGDWSILVDDMYGKLFYNAAGDEFEYIFCGCGLANSTDYSLIYYADFEDRFTQWGGNNPGALITEMTTDGCGSVFTAGSVELNMDLPDSSDANSYFHHYSGAPDLYAHDQGAKIWLVPSNCYDAGLKKVTTWSPSGFLFETDLISYDDTDVP